MGTRVSLPRPWPALAQAGPRRGFARSVGQGVLCLLLIMASGRTGYAQGRPMRGLQATGGADLRFGTVLPGIPTQVLPTANRGAGMFEIRGDRNMPVSVSLLLPTAMTTPSGAQLPLVFGPGDGVASPSRGRFAGVGFDPRNPIVATLGPSGRLYVRLGGTAVPARLQTSGQYQATITLSVANLGS